MANDSEECPELNGEIGYLQETVAYVTNWILETGETLLNSQQKIGTDVTSCDFLRRKHETLEMHCLQTYGLYAEILHKIDGLAANRNSFAHADLRSQKDFMNFVCRSFATRLEKRRNLLITSLRFYRLVSIYFDKTNEVFETLVMSGIVHELEVAIGNLKKLRESQQTLGGIEKELRKEGEKLSDILAMPVKDALGRDIGVDYSDEIVTIRDILDATIARRKIFMDSVELQKLTLEQIAHIQTCENDAAVAINWMDDLYNVMIKENSHVGSNINEIQLQKEELLTFQETAKGIYKYACQLLDAASVLRDSCKLNESNFNQQDSRQKLGVIWQNFQSISQEQMTRLRVSAVFHRSIDEYCTKLNDLKTNVIALANNAFDDAKRMRNKLKECLACREKVLLDVGRMVRLGRLLKTRLKESFNLDSLSELESLSPGAASPKRSSCLSQGQHEVQPTNSNAVACNAITQKLSEVAELAESLDFTLKNMHIFYELKEIFPNFDDLRLEKEIISCAKLSIEDQSTSEYIGGSPTLACRSASSDSYTLPMQNVDEALSDIDGLGSDISIPSTSSGKSSTSNYGLRSNNLVQLNNTQVDDGDSEYSKNEKESVGRKSSQFHFDDSWESYCRDKISKDTMKAVL